MSNPGVSVNIFGYNSENIIGQMVEHLARQRFVKKINWEVILVDNNSTDKTCEAALQTWQKLKVDCPFQIVRENRQGSSYAHLKGIETSKYDIMIFADQDNLLWEDYVDTAFQFMSGHPEAGLCGGQSIGRFEKDPPPWYHQFHAMIAVGRQGIGIEDVTETRKFVWGASSVIRRPAILKAMELGFSLISPGRAGKKLLAGDDMELAYAVRALGYKIYYHENLKFYHLIPASRLRWEYLKIIYRGYGNSTIWSDMYDWYLNNKYHSMPIFWQWIRHFLTLIKPVLKYNVLLLAPVFPKGSVLATYIEVVRGRIQELFTTSFKQYYRNSVSVRNFFINIRKAKLTGEHK